MKQNSQWRKDVLVDVSVGQHLALNYSKQDKN